MQAIIMAGGKGTRLRQITKLPKTLIELNQRSLLYYLLELLKDNKVTNTIICTGYGAEKIAEYVKGKDVRLSYENKALGTAGPLQLIKDKLENEFFVLYGDVYTEIDLQKMLEFHREKNADATLVLHASDHAQDSTIVSMNDDYRITNFVEKPGNEWKKYGNLTSAALYILKKDVLDFIKTDKNVDFAKDVFPKMLKKKMYGYVTEEYTKDIGTPQRYEEVKQHLKPTVFLDRDGTINEEIGFITKPEQLKLIKGAAEGIKLLNDNSIRTVIVTNQPVVARNMINEEQLKKINDSMLKKLAEKGARIDALYYCPHHPEKNHPEANNPNYRIDCNCRKPKTGMIDKAAKKFKIGTKNSYVVGDRTVDIQLGKNAGCKTILVKTGYKGEDKKHNAKADYECFNLLEACKIITRKQ